MNERGANRARHRCWLGSETWEPQTTAMGCCSYLWAITIPSLMDVAAFAGLRHGAVLIACDLGRGLLSRGAAGLIGHRSRSLYRPSGANSARWPCRIDPMPHGWAVMGIETGRSITPGQAVRQGARLCGVRPEAARHPHCLPCHLRKSCHCGPVAPGRRLGADEAVAQFSEGREHPRPAPGFNERMARC